MPTMNRKRVRRVTTLVPIASLTMAIATSAKKRGVARPGYPRAEDEPISALQQTPALVDAGSWAVPLGVIFGSQGGQSSPQFSALPWGFGGFDARAARRGLPSAGGYMKRLL
jgi:hypothetical protein